MGKSPDGSKTEPSVEIIPNMVSHSPPFGSKSPEIQPDHMHKTLKTEANMVTPQASVKIYLHNIQHDTFRIILGRSVSHTLI